MCILILKIVSSNHHTDKPHHLPSHAWLFQPEAKLIRTSPQQGNHPTVQLASTVQNKRNASKTTHDVTKLLNSQVEQPKQPYRLAPLQFAIPRGAATIVFQYIIKKYIIKMSSTVETNCYGFALGAANYVYLLQGATSIA